MQEEWQRFLEEIKTQNVVAYNAICNFKFTKIGEDQIRINYPSESAKTEFDAIQSDFFNGFKHKVKHFKIETEFVLDHAIRQEVVTKRSVFEKMLKINPLLKDLDDLMKFDFS